MTWHSLRAHLLPVQSIESHTFLWRYLSERSVVVDFGGNKGRFTHEMIRRFGMLCYTAEPTPALRQFIAPHPRLRLFPYAIADRDGQATFYLDSNSEASSLLTPGRHDSGQVQVETRRLDSFLREAGLERVDLLKLDIEGAEIPMFDSTSDDLLCRMGQITVEFHDFVNITPPADIHRVVARLRALGFRTIRFSHYNQDWLFINPRLVPVSALDLAYTNYLVRNVRGGARKLRYWLHLDGPAPGAA